MQTTGFSVEISQRFRKGCLALVVEISPVLCLVSIGVRHIPAKMDAENFRRACTCAMCP